jgi:hypothetical protein
MSSAVIGLVVLTIPLFTVLALMLYDNRRYSMRTLFAIMTAVAILAAICSLMIR